MNPKDKHADWLLKPTANDLADELDRMLKAIGLTGNRIPTILRQQEVEIKRITSKYEEMLRQQQADLKDADKYALELERLYEDAKAEIEALNQRIERMIENASHHEGIAHAGGFETGYQAGLKKAQEK